MLQQLNRLDAALASYDRAIALRPGYANAHFNRGSLLKRMNRPEDALAAYDQAIALQPDHAEALNNRGVVLQEMKRYHEALASYDRAILVRPRHAEALNNRGTLLVSLGDMTEAEKMFRRALEIKPDFSDPWFNLAGIHPYQDAGHADVKRIRDLLERPGLPLEHREQLEFALGKIYDDCQCHDAAFDCYQRANRIRNSRVVYDSNRVTALTNAIQGVFDRDYLAQPFPFASTSRVPLFIVGMPRAGTTLLASILSNHRSIATAGELPDLIDFADRLSELTPFPQAVRYLPPIAAMRLTHNYEQRLQREADPGAAYVIDKNPLNFRNLGLIARLFPQARILHCTRQPVDLCLSNYFQRFPLRLDYSFDLRNIAHFYREYLRVMEHWRTLPIPNLMEISYEDMVLHTEPTVRRALKFLGLTWDERCLAPHTNPCAVETASQWQVRQPIYQSSIGRWRHYEKHIAPLMELAGQGKP